VTVCEDCGGTRRSNGGRCPNCTAAGNVLRRPEPDVVAEGIDRVLDHFPGARVEWTKISDYWTVLKLVGGTIVVGEIAIWNATGNAYAVGSHGAAEDEPFIIVTPLRDDHEAARFNDFYGLEGDVRVHGRGP
jgi:hypothetical protein